MVNFRGALRGLGTGLAQVGQMQLQEQYRIADDQRLADRAAALARLNSQLANENADIDAERDLKTNARRDTQLIERRGRELKTEAPFRQEERRETAALEAERDEREQRQEESRDQRELRQEIARENRAAAREEAQERRRLEREGDSVVDRYVNDQDQRVLVTRSGQEIVLQNRVRRTGDPEEDRLRRAMDGDETPARPDSRAPAAATARPSGRQSPPPRDVPVGTVVRNPRTGERMRLKADGTWERVR